MYLDYWVIIDIPLLSTNTAAYSSYVNYLSVTNKNEQKHSKETNNMESLWDQISILIALWDLIDLRFVTYERSKIAEIRYLRYKRSDILDLKGQINQISDRYERSDKSDIWG